MEVTLPSDSELNLTVELAPVQPALELALTLALEMPLPARVNLCLRAHMVTSINDDAQEGECYKDCLARLAAECSAARWQRNNPPQSMVGPSTLVSTNEELFNSSTVAEATLHSYTPEASGWGEGNITSLPNFIPAPKCAAQMWGPNLLLTLAETK